MKTILITITLAFSLSFLNSSEPAGGIKFFQGKWKEVAREAEEQNKPVCAIIHAEWCGPCKRMEKYVFNDPEVGKVMNEYFVNYLMDADDMGDKSRAKSWGVMSVPAIIFIKDGEVAYISKGGDSPDAFLEEVSIAMRRMDIGG